jgi:hypothetical protein
MEAADNQQVVVPAVTRQKLAIEGRSRAGKVTGKLKIAMDLMVWEKLTRSEAGKRAGLAESSMREAFRRPHVIAYYRAGCDALRENVAAKHIHNLDKIADDSKNDMARVASIKALAQMYASTGVAFLGASLFTFAFSYRHTFEFTDLAPASVFPIAGLCDQD